MSYVAETHGTAVTSWIPLTTPFTVPQSCSTLFSLAGDSLVAFDPHYGVTIDKDAICQPPAVTTWWLQASIYDQSGLQGVHTAWSLLPFTCPVGFQTAASSLVNGGASTLAFCCPNDYTVINEAGGTNFGNCVSEATSGQVETYVDDQGSSSRTTFDGAEYIGAIAVQGYALSTTVSSTTTSSTTAPTTSSSATATISQTSSPTLSTTNTSASSSASTPDPSPSSNDELSTGAKAGIGIGASLGFIGIAALIVALVIMLRRRNAPSVAPAEQTSDGGPPKYPEDGKVDTTDPGWQRKQDMQQTPNSGWNELPTEMVMRELDGTRPVAELEGHAASPRP